MNQHRAARIRTGLSTLSDAIAGAWQYAVAIEAISAHYRSNQDRSRSAHLYRVHYGALWEALIVRLELIYDKTKGTNSFGFIAQQLAKLGTSDGRRTSSEIRNALERPDAQRLAVVRWRQDVVAHRRVDLDAAGFDALYPLDLQSAQASLRLAEHLLASAASCIGHPGWYFEVLKEEAMQDAVAFLNERHAA